MWRSWDGTEPRVMGLEVLCKEFCDRQPPRQSSVACVWSSLFCSLLCWKSPDYHPRIAIQQKWRYIFQVHSWAEIIKNCHFYLRRSCFLCVLCHLLDKARWPLRRAPGNLGKTVDVTSNLVGELGSRWFSPLKSSVAAALTNTLIGIP